MIEFSVERKTRPKFKYGDIYEYEYCGSMWRISGENGIYMHGLNEEIGLAVYQYLQARYDKIGYDTIINTDTITTFKDKNTNELLAITFDYDCQSCLTEFLENNSNIEIKEFTLHTR